MHRVSPARLADAERVDGDLGGAGQVDQVVGVARFQEEFARTVRQEYVRFRARLVDQLDASALGLPEIEALPTPTASATAATSATSVSSATSATATGAEIVPDDVDVQPAT